MIVLGQAGLVYKKTKAVLLCVAMALPNGAEIRLVADYRIVSRYVESVP